VALFTAPAHGQEMLFKSTTTGNPQVKSITAISFGPQGLLLIGDSTGAQIVAVDTGDTTPMKWTKNEIPNITGELAERLGTTAKGITIVKMAVNPTSAKAYFAIKAGAKNSIILTVDGNGKIGECNLDNVKYARFKLPGDGKSKVTLITDVVWAGDRVLAACQANETFGSKIVSVPAPLQNDATATIFSTETYHVAHGQWETKAPIRTVMPYQLDGKRYLVGAFTCTPIVKYDLTDLKAGDKVKGQTVIELGNGNQPGDMFVYKKGGKDYILMSTYRNPKFHQTNPVGPSPYWVAKVDGELLKETVNVNTKAVARVKTRSQPLTDRAQVVPTFHGTMLMDQLDEQRALVIRTDDKGNRTLAALPLP